MTKRDLAEDFGLRLRALMERYSITQGELAEDIGVSRQMVSQYVNGYCLPTFDKLVNILYVIGCDFESLVDVDEMIKG